MAISSMTGFARSSGEANWGSWVWEAKSVNGRGLDARLNMPSGLEMLDKAVRKGVSARFARGNMQIGLRIDMASGGDDVTVNKAVLNTLMDAYARVDGTVATGPALATLMSLKGVVETGASSLRALAEQPEAIAALQASALELLDLLKISRDEEGVKLHDMLFGHLSEIDALSRAAAVFATEQAVSIQQVYRARIAELDQDGAVSDERIAGEIAVLASKADVSEELDRLCAHIETGRALLASDDAVGRNLGFLAQELNREANTLCSKSASLDLTNAGLALKSVIDQFKEQAANVE